MFLFFVYGGGGLESPQGSNGGGCFFAGTTVFDVIMEFCFNLLEASDIIMGIADRIVVVNPRNILCM